MAGAGPCPRLPVPTPPRSLPYLPLVPMQQGRPVMTQSMCRWLVWFPALFLVQIWRGAVGEGAPPQGRPHTWLAGSQAAHPSARWEGVSVLPGQPKRSPACGLTGHLVMSSGHSWGSVEAGCSHTLQGTQPA